jgi:hypothetical protein
MELADIFLPHCFRIDIGETVGIECFGEMDEADDGTGGGGIPSVPEHYKRRVVVIILVYGDARDQII